MPRPPAPEDYTGIYMETKDVSLPLLANCVTPYGANGGWGYLTAGTLLINTKSKSFGILGQGTGLLYGLSANFRSMQETTC